MTTHKKVGVQTHIEVGLKHPARLGIQQRVLPPYRAPFFDALAKRFTAVGLFAGEPQAEEAIGGPVQLEQADWSAACNLYIGRMPDCLFWQRGLSGWSNEFKPNVLVMEANLRNLGVPPALRWMHSRRRPVIGWGLGAPAAGGVRRTAWQAFLGQFDALIAYSRRGAGEYAALGIPEEKIFVAHNAAAPRPTEPPIARPPVYQDERPVILFVGRLQARKRVDLLLHAAATLPADCCPQVIVVGDGPARPQLESLAQDLALPATFTGARHGADLEPLYRQADLFVLPGTGGLAIQQAMAHALPVIVAEGDGTQDDLVRAENGWQVPPGDLNSLTATIVEALEQPERLRQMGRESYRIVSEEVNLENMVAVFEQAVDSLFPTCMNY